MDTVASSRLPEDARKLIDFLGEICVQNEKVDRMIIRKAIIDSAIETFADGFTHQRLVCTQETDTSYVEVDRILGFYLNRGNVSVAVRWVKTSNGIEFRYEVVK